MQQWWRSVPRALLNIQVRNHRHHHNHQQRRHHFYHHNHHHQNSSQCQGHPSISRYGTIVNSTFTVATHFMMMTIDNCCFNADNDKNLLPAHKSLLVSGEAGCWRLPLPECGSGMIFQCVIFRVFSMFLGEKRITINKYPG